MVTPDFEDWLLKQEIRPEHTATIDDYIEYLKEELGIKGGSLDVAREIYEQKYESLAAAEIRPVERRLTIAGEEFRELRFAIKGMPGLYGRLRAYEIAADRLEAMGKREAAAALRSIISYLEEFPERRLARWRAEEH